MSFWNSVTDAQATIVAAGLTILAAIVGVLLGSWLFGGRVKDLDSAVSASRTLLEGHKEEVAQTLSEIRTQMSSLAETIGQVRGTLADQQSVAEVAPAPAWEDIRAAWEAVRDRLEQLAARPDVDGRTRAKYARIDRRSYYDLIDSMANDNNLPNGPADYRNAYGLWMRYRNNRREPLAEDLQALAAIRDRVTAGVN